MKFKALLVGALLATSATTAFAAGPYVGASGGVSIFHDSDIKSPADFSGTVTGEYDTGFGFNLSAGYNFVPVRVEAEFGYRKADLNKLSGPGGSASVNDSDVTVYSYMANGYYDFKTGSPLTPFVGAGLGVVHGKLSVPGDSASDTEFGYQFMVGAAYQVNRNLDLELTYRFQGSASDFTDQGVSVSYNSSNIFAGVRYNF